MRELADDDQRWEIFELFGQFGVQEPEQIRADIMRILKLDYLADLRELTRAQADDLIGRLRLEVARKAVSDG